MNSIDMAAPDNPYQPPTAPVLTQPGSDEDWAFSEPHAVPFSHGWTWLVEGFRLFKRNPLNWIVVYLLFMVINFVIALLPLLSIALYVVMPIFTAGLMLGARDQDQGKDLEINHLFAGFSAAGGNLALIGVLLLAAVIVAWLLTMAVYFALYGSVIFSGALAQQDNPEQMMSFFVQSFAVVLVVNLVLMTPVLMAYFFSPGLMALHKQELFDSLKYSFLGTLRNILPLTLFALLIILLGIVAILPLGLGLLILGPIVITAMYAAYKDIYTVDKTAATTQG